MIAKCEICKKDYYIRPSHFKRRKRHFCSIKCRGLGESGKNNPAWKDSWEKICKFCGKIFRHKDGKGKKYCCQRCMGLGRTKERTQIVKCVICSKEFKRINALPNKKCCGKKCSDKLHSLKMTGSGNTNWQDGIGKSPYEWKFNNKLKNEIRTRDNFRCKLCGNEVKKIKGWGLAIHHIDYNKQNSNPNNLISLCNKCHGFTHYNREQWKQKLSNLLKK